MSRSPKGFSRISNRSRILNDNLNSRIETDQDLYSELSNSAFKTINPNSFRHDEQSMFSMKEPQTSPKFNSVNEKSVVENSGVYEFLERQYKAH